MKQNDIKLAIFDIDDTLIKRGKTTIEQSAVDALKTLEKNGIEVMVATGRAIYFVHDDVKTTLDPDYYVTTNGACVYHHQELIYKTPMELDEVNGLITYARENNLGIALKMEKDMPVYNDLNIFQTVYMQGSSKQHILTDKTNADLFKDGDTMPMGVFMMGDEEKIEASSYLAPQSHYAHAYHEAYDVYSLNAGKIKGIEHVLSLKGLTWENVISFGDAANDLDMIQKAKIGVALGNAIEPLKERADYVTTNIDDNGVYNALKHFDLI